MISRITWIPYNYKWTSGIYNVLCFTYASISLIHIEYVINLYVSEITHLFFSINTANLFGLKLSAIIAFLQTCFSYLGSKNHCFQYFRYYGPDHFVKKDLLPSYHNKKAHEKNQVVWRLIICAYKRKARNTSITAHLDTISVS